MAIPTPTQVTQTLPSPYLTGAFTALGERLLPLLSTTAAIPTSTYAQQVAPETALQQQARGMAGGLGDYQQFLTQAQQYSGPQAFQQFMSPYQQQVIDTTLSEFDKQRQAQLATLNANAIAQGAFGGGREGVQRAEFGAQTLQDRAALQAQLLQQGFGQAQALANQAFLQQQQLATLQPSLTSGGIQQLGAVGTSDLAYRQSILDAQAQAAREAAYEPFQRLGFFGSALSQAQAGIPANYFTQTSGIQQPTTSPLSQALSTGLTAYGLGSLFGGRR